MNEEIDKIASAALDGEATEAELAEYFGDPEFEAAQSELALASGLLAQSPMPTPPSGLAGTQISVAMSEYRANAAQAAIRAAEPVKAVKSPARLSVGFPRWFAPAFFSIAVIAGVGFAAMNLQNSDSDEAGLTASDSGDVSSLRQSEGAATSTTMEAALAEYAEAAEADDAGDATFAADNERLQAPADIVVPASPFVANRSMLPVDIEELTRDATPVDKSGEYRRCGVEQGFEPPEAELSRVFAFTYADEPAELLVYRSAEDVVIAIIVGNQCEVLAHS